MRRLTPVLGALVLTLALVGCSSSKSNQGSAPTDPAAFASGLAWFYAPNDGGTPATLPDGLAACVQKDLGRDDQHGVSTVHSKANTKLIPDDVAVHIFRLSSGCDHDWLAQHFADTIDLSKYGITSATDKQCISSQLVDKITALDDATLTSQSGAAITQPLIDSLTTCVPIAPSLAYIVASAQKAVTPAIATCIGDAAAKTVTWDMVIKQDPALATNLTTAAAGCPTS